MKPYAKTLMGANGSWWFPIGKTTSGTNRHHQCIGPSFHWFSPPLEPLGDLPLGPMVPNGKFPQWFYWS